MLKLTYNELCDGSMRDSAIDGERRLIGSYPELMHSVINDHLTKTQKRYILLYYGKGMTLAEIAEQFGVNKSTVSRTLRRGCERLRRAVGATLLKKALAEDDEETE